MIILFKSYLRRLLVFSILIASIVALTNFFVDPGGVYKKYRSNASIQTARDFVEIVVESNFGVLMPENLFNEREIVRELASFPQKYDCAIIGISHVKQISLLRKNKSLSSLCSSTRNLGLSGASLEDYIAISNIILRNEFMPNKVFFLLLPYHHYVIDYKDQPITETLNKVDAKISELATILQVNVIGSYNPYDLECQKDEFYDESHPKDSCLAKLTNKVK